MDPESCLNRAAADEPVFVLRAKDLCAPAIISMWCALRVFAGKNERSDPQVLEALELAAAMEAWRACQGLEVGRAGAGPGVAE